MKLRKLLLYCIAILSLLALTLFIVINSWTNTPYGKLDPKVAILLKYIEFAKIDLFEKGRSPEDIRSRRQCGREPFSGCINRRP